MLFLDKIDLAILFNYVFFLTIETADLLQKLSLDSQKKGLEISEPTKKVIVHILAVIWLIYFYWTIYVIINLIMVYVCSSLQIQVMWRPMVRISRLTGLWLLCYLSSWIQTCVICPIMLLIITEVIIPLRRLLIL